MSVDPAEERCWELVGRRRRRGVLVGVYIVD